MMSSGSEDDWEDPLKEARAYNDSILFMLSMPYIILTVCGFACWRLNRLPFTATARIDIAYMFVHQSDRSGRTSDGGLAIPTTAVNNGIFHSYANLLGVSLVFGF